MYTGRKRRYKLNMLIVSTVLLTGIAGICGAVQTRRERGGAVYINEVCACNFSAIRSEDGNYYDYIELYNASASAVSLEGYTLQTAAKDEKYVFGEQTIAAGGYLVVFASGLENGGADTDELHAAFKISSGGESLLLKDASGSILDSVIVPPDIQYNTSYGRETDASENWALQETTPSRSNGGAKAVLPQTLEAPVFSADSGFYEEPFLLAIQARKGEQIYYTLDGSEPDTDSIPYTEPIAIADASGNENVYSARTDLSAAFFAEEERFAVPEEKVDKAVIVRAAAFDEAGASRSATVTRTYFVGFEDKGYEDFSVISLVTDPNNLFDYETGIYVSGKRFDDFVESGEMESMNNPDNWRRWQGNYTNKGREWERPVHIDFFDEDRELVVSQEAGLRIKGGTSRSFTQKSLKLYARNIYSGIDEFAVPFFGECGRKRAVLFSGAQDYRTKIQDALLASLCSGRAFSVMESYPCYVFLDGEYWGIYYVTEDYGDEYLEERYGVPDGEGVIVRNGSLDTDAPGSESLVGELDALMEADTEIDAAEYEKICRTIDMRSYLDYYAAEIYVNRGGNDWPGVNEAYWRTINDLGTEYTDGRWRWMLFDTNWALLDDASVDSIAYTKEKSGFFRRLCENETFRQEFVLTMCDLANSVFRLENVAPIFTELSDQMRGSVVKDLKKYYGDNRSEEDFDKEIQCMAVFFQEREAHVYQHLAEEFELHGTPENVTVSCTEGGSVTLNTISLPAGTESWTGRYFTDYPLKLTAVPEDGWHFAGWMGDMASDELSVEVCTENGGITLRAVFERD